MGGNKYLDDDSSETSSIDSQIGDIHEIVRTADLLDVKKAILMDRPRLICLKDESGRQVLHYAAELDRVKVALFLISKNADLNAVDSKDQTPLVLAAAKGLTNMCRFLLDFKANIHIKDNAGWTALHHAVYGNFFDTAVLLIKRGSNLKAQDYQSGRTVLHLASELGYAEMVKMLLMRGSNLLGIGDDLFAKSPLHYACDHNHLSVMKLLLQHGANVNLLCGLIDQTPLHITSQKGLVEASQILLQYHAEINIIGANTNGYSPLHLACEYNHWNMVELLLQFSANINQLGKYTILGKTPLHIACSAGQLQIVHLLCNIGLLATTTNSSAVHNNHVSVSTAVTTTNNNNKTSLSDHHRLDLNIQDEHGYTPLHIACIEGYYDIALMLLDYGANATIPSYNHKYALDYVTQPMIKHEMEKIIQIKLQQSIEHKITEQYQQYKQQQEEMIRKQQETMAKQKALELLQYETRQLQLFVSQLSSIVQTSGEVNLLEKLWEGVIEGKYKEHYINERLYLYGSQKQPDIHERYGIYQPHSSEYMYKDDQMQNNLVSKVNGNEILGSSMNTIYNNPGYHRLSLHKITNGVIKHDTNLPSSSSVVLYQPQPPVIDEQQSITLFQGGLLDDREGNSGVLPVVGIGNPPNISYYTYPIIQAALQGYYPLVEMLLVWPGIDLNAQDSEGNTALHYAASNNHIDIVELLLLQPQISNSIVNKEGKVAANMTTKLFIQDIIRNPMKIQKKYQYQQMVAKSLPSNSTNSNSNSSNNVEKKKKLFPTLTTKVKEQNIYDIILPSTTTSTNNTTNTTTNNSNMQDIITSKYNLLVTKEIVSYNEQHYNPLLANKPQHLSITNTTNTTNTTNRPLTLPPILSHSNSSNTNSNSNTNNYNNSNSSNNNSNSNSMNSIQTIDPILLSKYGPLPSTFISSTITNSNDFFTLSNTTANTTNTPFPDDNNTSNSNSTSSVSYFTHLSHKQSHYFQDVYTLQAHYPPSVFDHTNEYQNLINTLWLVGYPYYYYYKHVYTTNTTTNTNNTSNMIETLYLNNIILLNPTHTTTTTTTNTIVRPIERYDMRILGYQLSKILTTIQHIYCTPARLYIYPIYTPNTTPTTTHTTTNSDNSNRVYSNEEIATTETYLSNLYHTQFPTNIHYLDIWRLEWYGYNCFEYLTLYLASYEYDSIDYLLTYYTLSLPSMCKLTSLTTHTTDNNSDKGVFQWGSMFITKLFIYWHYCTPHHSHIDHNKPLLPSSNDTNTLQSMSKEEYAMLLQWYIAYSELLHHYTTLIMTIVTNHTLSNMIYEQLITLLQHCSLFHTTINPITTTTNTTNVRKKVRRKEKEEEGGDKEVDIVSLIPFDPLQTSWSCLVLNPPRSLRNSIDCLYELSSALIKYEEHYYSADIIRTELWKYAFIQLYTQQTLANHYYNYQLPLLLNIQSLQVSQIAQESPQPSDNPSISSLTPLQLWLHDLQLLSYESYFIELGFTMLEDFQELNDDDCHLYFPFLKIGDMRRMKKMINELDDQKVAKYVKKVQKMKKNNSQKSLTVKKLKKSLSAKNESRDGMKDNDLSSPQQSESAKS